MDTVILSDVSIGYAAKTTSKVVAAHLHAAISSGELTCLLGRNGIGKSTLLRTLSAFQPPLSGDILMTIDGRPTPLHALTSRQLSRTVGIVLTERPDVQNMTARELVGMGRQPYTGFWGTLSADDLRIVDDAIDMVGITPLSDRPVHTLSDGERQKVMIAKALAQQTPVIYLDEPTAFLDFPSKVETMQLLKRLARGDGQTEASRKTIFLSTHDVELAIALADKLWLMEPHGLCVGTPRQLADQGALSRFIDRPGITFDRETRTIHVTENEKTR